MGALSNLAAAIGIPLSSIPFHFRPRTANPDDMFDFSALTRSTRRERRAAYLKQHQHGAGSKLARKAREGKLGIAVLR